MSVADCKTPFGDYRVCFDPTPFCEGAMKVAHLGILTHPKERYGERVVIKKFKGSHAYSIGDWAVDIKTTNDAEELAGMFNTLSKTTRPIQFRKILLMQVSSTV